MEGGRQVHREEEKKRMSWGQGPEACCVHRAASCLHHCEPQELSRVRARVLSEPWGCWEEAGRILADDQGNPGGGDGGGHKS